MVMNIRQKLLLKADPPSATINLSRVERSLFKSTIMLRIPASTRKLNLMASCSPLGFHILGNQDTARKS